MLSRFTDLLTLATLESVEKICSLHVLSLHTSVNWFPAIDILT